MNWAELVASNMINTFRKPCPNPACGGYRVYCSAQTSQYICNDCGTSGPGGDEDGKKWDSLPRDPSTMDLSSVILDNIIEKFERCCHVVKCDPGEMSEHLYKKCVDVMKDGVPAFVIFNGRAAFVPHTCDIRRSFKYLFGA